MNSAKTLVPIVSLLSLLVFAQGALAWGPLGHKVTGQVAESMLLPQAKQKLRALLENQSLPEAVNWADTIKSNPDWKFASWYHFEKIHDQETYLESVKGMTADEQKRGGMVTGILEAEKVFLSKTATTLEKQMAVKFLVHFIGDAHQPLHTGKVEDNGGNKVLLKWNGKEVTLHSVWDIHIMALGHPEFQSLQKGPDANYAQFLIRKFQGLPVDQGKVDDVNAWVNESMAMRDGVYNYYNKENEAQYTARFLEDVDRRLYLSGLRMASFLNQMVMKEQQPAVRLGFRKAIEDVTGSLSKYIFLKPQATTLY